MMLDPDHRSLSRLGVTVIRLMAAEPERKRYGAEIAGDLKVARGTLYPLLKRLTGWSWLVAIPEDVDPSEARRPARIYYLLTQKGLAEAGKIESAPVSGRQGENREAAHAKDLPAKSAPTDPISQSLFSIGPLKTDLCIVEGDGEQVISEHATRVIVDRDFIELPEEIAKWRDEIAEKQARNRAAGKPYFWNGENYAVDGLVVAREGVDENPEVVLRLKSSDYFAFLATQQLDRRFRDGTTPRMRYLDPSKPQNAPAFMCSSFGTNVAVVSADKKVLFAQRSKSVGSRPGVWNSSANEAISRSLDSRGRSGPNLYDVARRGLSEELAIDPSEYRLELLAFSIDVQLQQWGALFAAFMREITAKEIATRRGRGVPDKWENSELDFAAFDVQSVIQYMLRPDRIEEWAPTAPALFYLTLVRYFGRVTVERQTRALLVKTQS